MTVRELYLVCNQLLKEQHGSADVYIHLDKEQVATIKDCEEVDTYLNVTRVTVKKASRSQCVTRVCIEH